jgi:hypothetical protein
LDEAFLFERSIDIERRPIPLQIRERDREALVVVGEPKLAEGERRMVDQNSASWNRLAKWLAIVDTLRRAA